MPLAAGFLTAAFAAFMIEERGTAAALGLLALAVGVAAVQRRQS